MENQNKFKNFKRFSTPELSKGQLIQETKHNIGGLRISHSEDSCGSRSRYCNFS